MIYVKDYQALGRFSDGGGSFRDQLESLKGRMVVLFTQDGRQFTGLLLDVLEDRLRLMTALPAAPRQSARCARCGRPTCPFGCCTVIRLSAVTAVSMRTV